MAPSHSLMMFRMAGISLSCFLCAAAGLSLPSPDSLPSIEAPEVAPTTKFFPAEVNGVPERYGVTLFAVPAASAAAELVSSVGGTLGFIYQYALNGFEAQLTDAQAELLSQDPLVKDVVQETYILADAVSYDLPDCYQEDPDTNTNSLPDLPDGGTPVQVQDLNCPDPAPGGGDCEDNWGIDRLGGPRDQEYSYRHTGENVKVFVIDRGVKFSNREFNDGFDISRVQPGIDTGCSPYPACGIGQGSTPCPNGFGAGHGTHVASIVGGRTYGVARGVDIIPIRSLCSGSGTEAYKRAFEYIFENHGVNANTAIVNISGMNNTTCLADPSCGGYNQVRQAMINVASRDNILIIQSAGNQSFTPVPPPGTGFYGLVDACDRTLGDETRYTEAGDIEAVSRILVAGGSDENDGLLRTENGDVNFPSGSNVGRCVDIFAPAAHVASAFHPDEDPDPDTMNYVCELSGTSQAAPHVAGVAAMILDLYPTMPSRVLHWAIRGWGFEGELESDEESDYYIGAESPNLLLHWEPGSLMADGFDSNDFRVWSDVEP